MLVEVGLLISAYVGKWPFKKRRHQYQQKKAMVIQKLFKQSIIIQWFGQFLRV